MSKIYAIIKNANATGLVCSVCGQPFSFTMIAQAQAHLEAHGGSLTKCPSGKIGLRSHDDALDMIRELKRKKSTARKRFRTLAAYFCRKCGKWHAGHKPHWNTLERKWAVEKESEEQAS